MRIALTGANGIVGGFILDAMRGAGHHVTTLDRRTGFVLGDAPDLAGHDALIHCAFAHRPGRYRGGEGDDPVGFQRDNLHGTIRLFDAAAEAGVGRILFLSSRAVHDGHPAGTALTDDLPASPANLYGEIKARAEEHLAALGLSGTSIRATGIYGPGPHHKWLGLFRDYLSGHRVAPRVGTELHGDDLAQALLLLLEHDAPPTTVNASDLILDRHDLLDAVRRLSGSHHSPPCRAEAQQVRPLLCDALIGMGWRPGGMARLHTDLPAMLRPALT